MAIVLRIGEVVREKKVLQKDLARIVGVSPVTMSYWCRNQTMPSLETLGVIAKALKVKVKDLIAE